MRKPSTLSERHVIGFLATISALMAFGVDASLPAIDDIRSTFDLAPEDNSVTQVISLYLLGVALGHVVYGPVADRFGRMPTLRFGFLLYILGATTAAIAPNLETLLMARAVWGFGASVASVLRTTIVRDLYAGNQMARVISVIMGFFLLGPIVAPLLGSGILVIATWRWLFAGSVFLCVILVGWSYRFAETLNPEDRRPLQIGPTLAAFRQVLTTRVTIFYLLAMTFAYGAFFTYIASMQPVLDVIYQRADWFAPVFSCSGVLMAISFFTVNRFIEKYGAHLIALRVLTVAFILSVSLLSITFVSGGRPPFWLFVIGIALINAFLTLLTPTGTALALEPMGNLAGTASGAIGLISMGGASFLSTLINAQISSTVTPMIAGYTIFGGLAFLCALASNTSE